MSNKLIPIWGNGEKYCFEFTKINQIIKSTEVVLNNKYVFNVELTRISDKLFEAYYPDGILQTVPKFATHKDYKLVINTLKPFKTIYYTVDEDLQIKEIINIEQIKDYLKQIKESWLNKFILNDASIIEQFDQLTNSIIDLKQIMSADISTFHTYFGVEKQIEKQLNLKETIVNEKQLQKISARQSDLNLLQLDYFDSDVYQMEHLLVNDTKENDKKFNLRLIQEEFNSGFLDIDHYENLLFQYEKHQFNNDDNMVSAILQREKLKLKDSIQETQIIINRVY